MEIIASGASRDDVVRANPTLATDGVAAAIAYAAGAVRNEVIWEAKLPE